MSSNEGNDSGTPGTTTTAPPNDAVSTITGGSTRSGTGGGRRRGQGGGRSGNSNDNRNSNNTTNSTKPNDKEMTEKYEGETAELKDFVFKLVPHKVAAVTCKDTLERIGRYAETEYKSSLMKNEIMTGVVQKPKLPEQEKDAQGNPKTDKISEALFNKRIEKFVGKEEHLENARNSMYSVIWGQCSPGIRGKVKAHKDYADAASNKENKGVVLLVHIIKSVMLKFQSQILPTLAIIETTNDVSSCKQEDMADHEYYDAFRQYLETAEFNGANFGLHSGLIQQYLPDGKTPNTASLDELKAAYEQASEAFKAILFLKNADMRRYGFYWSLLHTKYAQNQANNEYPTTLEQAYNYLVAWKPRRQPIPKKPPNNNPQNRRGNRGGGPSTATGDVSFANVGDETGVTLTIVAGIDGRTFPEIKCYNCQNMGHYSSSCPSRNNSNDSEIQMLMYSDDFVNFSFLNCAMNQTQGNSVIPPHWILLDNQSTVCVFVNKHLLRNIRTAPKYITVLCNAGVTRTNLIGDLPGFPEPVWYNPKGLANILSFAKAAKHFDIDYDKQQQAFILHRPDNTTNVFQQSDSGLYYWDARDGVNRANDDVALVTTVADKKSNYTNKAYRLANLARKTQNIIGFPSVKDYLRYVDNNLLTNCTVTRADIKAAEDIHGPNTRCLQGKTVRHSSPTPRVVITPIPPHLYERYKNITLCIDIMFVNKLPFVVTISKDIKFRTAEFILNRQHDTVFDAMHRVIKLYRLRHFRVTHCFGDPEFECLKADFADKHVTLETVADDEHVGEIERSIRTTKERFRSLYSGLRFQSLPHRATIEFVLCVIMWLNMFPPIDGVSDTISPRTLITGATFDYNTYCKIEPGAYVHTHEEHDNSTDTMRTIGAIALRPAGMLLGGYYFLSLSTGRRIHRKRFTELPMPEHVIDRVHALARRSKAANGVTFAYRDGTEVLDEDTETEDPDYDPEDDDDDDDDASDSTSITGVNDDNNTVENNNNDENTDENEDNNETNNEANTDDDIDDDIENNVQEEEQQQDETEQENNITQDEDSNADDDNSQNDDTRDEFANKNDDNDNNQRENNDHMNPDTPVDNQPIDDGNTGVTDTDADDSTETPGVANTDESTEIPGVADNNDDNTYEEAAIKGLHGTTNPADMDDAYGRRLRGGLRPRKQRDYTKHKLGPISETNLLTVEEPRSIVLTTVEEPLVRRINKPKDYLIEKPEYEPLEHVVLTQYSAKKGLEIFKEEGAKAILTEMKQLDIRDVIEPMHFNMLTREEKKSALEYLMFLKKKRCGRIKGRGCADGRKQRLYKTKEETSSPTATTESLFLSCVLDAMERRYVATVDIPGAFMQADIDETVYVRLTGPVAEIMAKVDPTKYKRFVHNENGKPVMYAKLKKALYGTVQAAYLFWKELSSTLHSWGFEPNPYDECVVNKTINGKQCTILWHVDDLKISHVEPQVVHDIIAQLNEKYGKEAPLTETTGKIHEYLGMTIDYSVDGKVIFRMDNYVKEIIETAGMHSAMLGVAPDPASDHLFTINEENPIKLDNDRSDLFHTLVAKMLFVAKRARPDIQQAVAFLTTRVSSPDEDDWKKLGRVVQYLRQYPDLALTLEADNTHIIKWWVDASFAVHRDMRSQTGATMSLGKGCPYSTSTRQKLNTTSSTEAELVGVADVMPMVLWTRNFLEAQGYDVEKNTIYQDNKSAILLEKNGRASSSKRTRHINIRYFFVADRVRTGEVTVEYCPTDEMVGDMYTKPLSGEKFKRFRAAVMNLPTTD